MSEASIPRLFLLIKLGGAVNYVRAMSSHLKWYAKENPFELKHQYKYFNDHANATVSLKLRLIWALKLVYKGLGCFDYDMMIQHAESLLVPGVMA